MVATSGDGHRIEPAVVDVAETESTPIGARTGTGAEAWWRGSVIAGLTLAVSIGVLIVIWRLAYPLALVFIAIVIAEVLAPIVNLLVRWMPRPFAVVVVYLALIAVIAGTGYFVVTELLAEGTSLVTNAPGLIQKGQEWLRGVDSANADRISGSLQSVIDRFGSVLAALPFTVFSSLFDALVVVFLSIYWLIATPTLLRFTLSLFPEPRRDRIATVLRAMGQTMGGYIRAVAINGVVVAIFTYAGLWVIGLDYALVLSVIAGFAEFLPVIGPIVASIPAIGIALIDSPQLAISVVVFFLLMHQLEANLLVPFIMRQQADVPPLLSLFALLAGSTIGGILGAIVAVPMAGALRVLVLRVLVPAEQEWFQEPDQSSSVGYRAWRRLRPGRAGRGP